MSSYHTSVLAREVIDALQIRKGQKYIDATVGGGGHTEEILKHGGFVLGIDTDSEAIQEAKERLGTNKNYTLVQGNFRDIERIANANGFERVKGVLFDLGVSSYQLDTPKRGFSYRFTDAPLDLRMNQSGGDTAAQLVNRGSEDELYEIFSTFGEEAHSRIIARAILNARGVKQIETVDDLVKIIGGAVADTNHGVMSRIFQALRIAVNDELESIKMGLDGAKNILEPNGRLVVISFHSLEDRIMKHYIKQDGWKAITKHPVIPTDREQMENRRSRSAKMRIAQKI